MTNEKHTEIELRNIKKLYPVSRNPFSKAKQWVHAVNGVDLVVQSGETMGIVGESGCGKSTLGLVSMKLIDPTEGQVFFEGQDITNLSGSELRSIRKNMQMIFQDPHSSLDPRMTVGEIIAEPLRELHAVTTSRDMLLRIIELLDECGLNRSYINRYPHEFSGGQRQRIGIARALAVNPKFILCDEPVSALDVSIQSQIINLLLSLQEKYQLTMIFISHDLSVIHHVSDTIAVMYLGKIVEQVDRQRLYSNPKHPYSRALLASAPSIHQKEHRRASLIGELPSPVNPPSGCPFHPRCDEAKPECSLNEPQLNEVAAGHRVSCLYAK